MRVTNKIEQSQIVEDINRVIHDKWTSPYKLLQGNLKSAIYLPITTNMEQLESLISLNDHNLWLCIEKVERIQIDDQSIIFSFSINRIQWRDEDKCLLVIANEEMVMSIYVSALQMKLEQR